MDADGGETVGIDLADIAGRPHRHIEPAVRTEGDELPAVVGLRREAVGDHMADDPTDPARLALEFLVLRCQTGDERAFERLLEQFGERTHRYLRGLVGDAADDVQQEVWLAVYRGIARLAAPHAFRTWLYRTTRNRARTSATF